MGVYDKFKYERIPLSLIKLDDRNPRIVTPTRLQSEEEIVRYFFEHEKLDAFLKKIASEKRNQGAERPYVVKVGKEYTVIEGNTRIAAYKLLTGQIAAPDRWASKVPDVPKADQEDLSSVDCTIAPNRDALMPIMASAHFGAGDKTKWGYLGSRKAIYDERAAGKSLTGIAQVFEKTPAEIRGYLLDYELYRVALGFEWTEEERADLMDPAVEFNPPIRFLQTFRHKELVGIDLDRTNIAVTFESDEAKSKLKHLVKKLVVDDEKGIGATASYADVFKDYVPPKPAAKTSGAAGHGASVTGATPNRISPASAGSGSGQTGAGVGTGQTGGLGSANGVSTGSGSGSKLKPTALLNYPVTIHNRLLTQLMKEARKINIVELPAAGTSLLRGIVEAVCKNIIETQGANASGRQHDLESAINLCLSNAVRLSSDDKSVLKQFKNNHLANLNLATHATVVPNHNLLMAARDTIDQFVMRNI